ncbi:hypothetical protein [Hoylesella shahii]
MCLIAFTVLSAANALSPTANSMAASKIFAFFLFICRTLCS